MTTSGQFLYHLACGEQFDKKLLFIDYFELLMPTFSLHACIRMFVPHRSTDVSMRVYTNHIDILFGLNPYYLTVVRHCLGIFAIATIDPAALKLEVCLVTLHMVLKYVFTKAKKWQLLAPNTITEPKPQRRDSNCGSKMRVSLS